MATITVYKVRLSDGVFDGDLDVEVKDPLRSPIPAGHTRTSPHPIPKNHYAVMTGPAGWQYIKGTKPPAPIPDNQNPDIVGAKVRDQRNKLLSESDWTQLDDSPITNAQKLEWASYRQALRDVPDQEGFPFDITWPVKP
jgi:hypothetical protein